MIVQNGVVVAEWGDVAVKSPAHSVRKSLLSALIGIAVEEGKIDLSSTLEELGIDDNEPSLTEIEKKATVGDLIKARSYFEKAIAKAPYNMATKVLWAENLSVKEDKQDEFKALLKEVIEFDVNAWTTDNAEAGADLGPELTREKEKARRILAKADELF